MRARFLKPSRRRTAGAVLLLTIDALGLTGGGTGPNYTGKATATDHRQTHGRYGKTQVQGCATLDSGIHDCCDTVQLLDGRMLEPAG